MKISKIALFSIVIVVCSNIQAQDHDCLLRLENVDKGDFMLPVTSQSPPNMISYYNWISNNKYNNSLNEVIDSCIISDDTTIVFFSTKDIYVRLDTIKHRYLYEFKCIANDFKSFSIKLKNISQFDSEQNIIILDSYCHRYYFKKSKKNRFKLYYIENFWDDENYYIRRKIRISYETDVIRS